jgi:hypothetical protein
MARERGKCSGIKHSGNRHSHVRECWHNNHHAFPESACIGLKKGQADPSWMFIKWLGKIGLAKNIALPRSVDQREDLILVETN